MSVLFLSPKLLFFFLVSVQTAFFCHFLLQIVSGVKGTMTWKSPGVLCLTFPIEKWSEMKLDEVKISRVFQPHPFKLQIQIWRRRDPISSEEILKAELWWLANNSGAIAQVESTGMVLHQQTRQPLMQSSASPLSALSGDRSRVILVNVFKITDVHARGGYTVPGDNVTVRFEVKGLPC